jgi:nucleoside-diphosphate-sugar epimerase
MKFAGRRPAPQGGLRLILVTGSSGFLGRSVCAQLNRQRCDFIGADPRSPEPCDVTDRSALVRLFRGHTIDTVVHLAGMLPSACRRNPAEATRVNVLGGASLLEVAAHSGVQRFVFGSSISVYCSAPADVDLDVDIYGAGKRYIETYGQALALGGSLAFVALRIATVAGPGARHTASPWRSEIFEKLGRGVSQRIAIPFGADAILSLVHVEDAAAMLILLATCAHIPSQVYDTPAENWRMRDLKEAIEALDGNLRIDLHDAASGGAPPAASPPLADGARFAADFGWRSAPLADRLAACLLE